MTAFVILCLIAAAVCFGLAALGVAPATRPDGTVSWGARVNLIALGLLFWVLTALVPALNAALT